MMLHQTALGNARMEQFISSARRSWLRSHSRSDIESSNTSAAPAAPATTLAAKIVDAVKVYGEGDAEV